MADVEIEWTRTPRGFRRGTFLDLYDEEFSIQKSSLATQPAIWLGRTPGWMHLSREMAGLLAEVLLGFAATGKLEVEEEA